MSELCLRNCVFNPRKKSKKWARNSKMREKSAQKAGISAWESQFLPVKRRKLSQESDSRPLLPLSQKKMHYPSFLPHTNSHTDTNTKTNHSKLPLRRSKLFRTKRGHRPSFARDYGQLWGGLWTKKSTPPTQPTTHPEKHTRLHSCFSPFFWNN